MSCSEDEIVVERCGIGVHAFNTEDAEVCQCGAMNADGTYRFCVEELHYENRCPPDCRLMWRIRNERTNDD